MNEYNQSALIWNKYIQSNISDQYLQNMFIAQLGFIQNCLFQTQLFDQLCINQINNKSLTGTINERIYLNPITKTRPDLDQLIPTILLKFRI